MVNFHTMKLHAILVTLFVWSCLSCFSQAKSKKVDIFWGPEQKTARQSTLSDIIGYDETGIYALKTTAKGVFNAGSSFVLEHYSNEMKRTKSERLELVEQGRSKKLEFITQFNDQLRVFSSFPNQKLKKNILYVQSINKRTLQLRSDLQKIGEIDYAGNSKRNAGGYDFVISRRGAKMLVYYNLPYERGQNEKFGFHMLDQDLNPIWEKQVTLPYKDELFVVEDYQVDDQGNVYLLGVVYKNKRKSKRNGLPNYQYRILAYTKNGTELNQYPIEIKEKFLTDMKIAVNEEGNIICGGFYSEVGTFSINGSYFLKVDGETKAILSKSFKEFGIDFITQNMTEKEERKTMKKERKGKDTELFNYDLNEIIIQEDGGAIFIGEQYFVKELNYPNPDPFGGLSYVTDYQYYYNDIIVVKVSPDGQLEWTEKIPKKQRTLNDNGFYSSYALSVVGDKLYFVFNDHPKNLFYKGSGKVHYFNKNREALVVLVEVDKEGKQTREALFSAKRSETLTRPLVCEQIATDELVLFCQRKKAHQFARVIFLE